MRRVVVTGMGIVSSIGNNTQEVLASLREAKIRHRPRPTDYAELGFRCQVHGAPTLDPARHGRPARDALHGRRRRLELRRHGAGDPRCRARAKATSPTSAPASSWARAARRRAPSSRPPTSRARRAPSASVPFAVPKAMSSTASATLATSFKIKGVNYSISSACATSAHCIGNAVELIQWGKQDIDVRRRLRGTRLDAVGPVRRHGRHVVRASTTRPRSASRAYDEDRDGFVIAGGAGVRGARGARARQGARRQDLWRDRRLRRHLRRLRHGAAVRRRRRALHAAWRCKASKRPVDYINPHATSTPVGDLKEIEAIREVFGDDNARRSRATKSLTGHSLGATGVQEAIYSLLMMKNGFICESANIDEARSGLRRHADRARAHGQCRARHACCRTASASAAPMPRWFCSVPTHDQEPWPWRSDGGQARPRHGRRQRPFHRLGHRPGARRARAPSSPSPIRARRFGKRVAPLAESVGAELIVPCDVEDLRHASIAVFDEIERDWGALDFVVHAIAFSDRNELKGRYADTTRENFAHTMVISCFSFTEIAQARRQR